MRVLCEDRQMLTLDTRWPLFPEEKVMDREDNLNSKLDTELPLCILYTRHSTS